MLRRSGTRRGWGLFALGLVTFFVLDVLALMGEDLATKLLVSLALFVLVEYLAVPLIRYFVG